MKRTHWICLALIAGLFATASTASALTFSRIGDVEEMATLSTLAFRGEVIDVRTSLVQTETRGAVPFTETLFRTTECLVGCRAGEVVTVRQKGGPIPDPNGGAPIVLTIPGLAEYQVGAEHIVFSNDRVHPLYGALWGAEGSFRVVESDDGRRLVVNSHGRPLMETESGPRFSRSLRCEQYSADARACAQWRSESGDTAADTDHHGHALPEPVVELDFATAAHLVDRAIDALRVTGAAPGAPQTLSRSRIDFQDGMRMILDQGNKAYRLAHGL